MSVVDRGEPTSIGGPRAFFTALFAGELMSDDLVDEMTTGRDGYGLGIGADGVPYGPDLVGHNGGIPGFTTVALHSPDTGRTGFWVVTSDAISPETAVRELAPLLSADSLESAIDAASVG